MKPKESTDFKDVQSTACNQPFYRNMTHWESQILLFYLLKTNIPFTEKKQFIDLHCKLNN